MQKDEEQEGEKGRKERLETDPGGGGDDVTNLASG